MEQLTKWFATEVVIGRGNSPFFDRSIADFLFSSVITIQKFCLKFYKYTMQLKIKQVFCSAISIFQSQNMRVFEMRMIFEVDSFSAFCPALRHFFNILCSRCHCSVLAVAVRIESTD